MGIIRSKDIRIVFFFLVLLSVVMTVFAVTNPTFIAPTPSNDSQVGGLVNFNFSFNGTANWTLEGDNSLGVLCAENNSESPQNCTWDTLTATETTYTFLLNTTNATNESDVNQSVWVLLVENPVNPSFVSPTPENGSNISGSFILNFTYYSTSNFSVYYKTSGSWSEFICGGSQTEVASPQSCTVDSTGITDNANYTFNVSISDSDNSSDSADLLISNLTIDNNAPALNLTGPDNDSLITNSIVDFNWSLSDAVDTNVTCTFTLNGVGNETLYNGTATTKTLADAAHSWRVNCTDYTGNTNTSETRTLTIDTTAPVLNEINITPVSTNNFTNETPVISMLVTEQNLASCEYQLGNGTWLGLSASALGGGEYLCSGAVGAQENNNQLNFSFRATDTAGLVTTEQPRNLTVDILGPNITILSPAIDYNISDGVSFTVTANVFDLGEGVFDVSGLSDGSVCSVTIEGASLLTGSVVYNESSGLCNGTVTLDDPSGITEHPSELWVSLSDRVNNTNTQIQNISIDNVAPVITTTGIDQAGNVVETLLEEFVLFANLFDNSFIAEVTAENETQINLSGSRTDKQTSVQWSTTTNASRLGCSSTGICEITVTANDSWGFSSTGSFQLIIDADSPQFRNEGINDTIIGTRESLLAYAEWIDQSLNSSSGTTAQLQKSPSFSTVLSTTLNSGLKWSNFTYIPTPADDEGENISLRISYSDFAGRTNTTGAFSFVVTNSSPVILNLTVLDRVNNISNETPTFTVQYADEGKGFVNSGVVLNLTGADNRSFIKNGTWVCEPLNTYNTTFLNNNSWINFTTSSYDATNYSFRINNIENAGSQTETGVVLERFLYGRASTIELESWGDSHDYEDIRVTLVSSNNILQNQTKLGFEDLAYTEQVCNFTASELPEGMYNVSLLLTDAAGNANESDSFSWVVDGSRPEIINLTAGNSSVFLDSNFVNTSVNISESVGAFSINWTINDTTLNTTNVTFWRTTPFTFTDASGISSNGTGMMNHEPGHKLVEIEAYDILGRAYATTYFFNIYFNPETDITLQHAQLTSVGENEVSYDNFTILRNGLNETGNASGRLNESIMFNISLTAATTSVNISTEGVDGLQYDWNNVFYFTNATSNSIIDAESGINSTFVLLANNFSDRTTDTKNDTYYYTQFLPTDAVVPNVNWTFNASGEPFIVLLSSPNTSEPKYLLEECSGDYNPDDYSEACYTNTSDIYTVYAPAFTGFALGQDAGAPNISVTFPSTPVNDSQFSIFVEVIEPSPNTTSFCDYGLYNNVTGIDVQTMNVSDFTLNQSRYTKSLPYTNFVDGSLYVVNVTCRDALGNSANISAPFTVTDTTPPSFLSVGLSGQFSTQADFNAELSEYGRIRLNISTDENNLNTQTEFSDFGNNVTLRVENLGQDTLYFYIYQACDINNQCAYYSENIAGFDHFRTNATGSTSSSGGGGGGGGGVIPEGAVVASHHHGWSVLEPGWLRYGIGEEKIAITSVNVLIENQTFDPFVQVTSYNGKAPSVPRIQPIAYQYLRLEHTGLLGSEYELEFEIPESWLIERSATPNNVHLYRLEKGNWSLYPVAVRPSSEGMARFRSQLPGFSFFVIQVDGVDIVEEVTNVTEQVNVTKPGNTTIIPDPGSEVDEKDEGEDKGEDNEGTVAGYDEASNMWWWVISIIFILIALSGGAWYVLSRKPVVETKQTLNPNDPFYKLQQYILHAIDKGHSREEIREKLIEVGWDEVIVDEEIESIMTGRV